MSSLLRAMVMAATLSTTCPAIADVAPDCKCEAVGGEASPAEAIFVVAGALLGAALLVGRRR